MRVARSLFSPVAVPSPVRHASVDAHLMDARAALSAGDENWALHAFDAVLRLVPTHAMARAGRLACLAALGREHEMAVEMEDDIARSDGSAVIELARMGVAQGNTPLALAVIRAAMQTRPDLGAAFATEPRLAGLRDHPLFLQITGVL